MVGREWRGAHCIAVLLRDGKCAGEPEKSARRICPRWLAFIDRSPRPIVRLLEISW